MRGGCINAGEIQFQRAGKVFAWKSSEMAKRNLLLVILVVPREKGLKPQPVWYKVVWDSIGEKWAIIERNKFIRPDEPGLYFEYLFCEFQIVGLITVG